MKSIPGAKKKIIEIKRRSAFAIVLSKRYTLYERYSVVILIHQGNIYIIASNPVWTSIASIYVSTFIYMGRNCS